MICLLSSRTRREVRSHPRFGWTGGGLTRCSVGRGRCGAAGPGLGSWGRGASEGGEPGVGLARGPCAATLRRISLSFWPRPEAAGPSRNDCGRAHGELIRNREVYSNTILPQETKRTTNKQPNFTHKTIGGRRTNKRSE